MASTPAELNRMRDDELKQFLMRVLDGLGDGDSPVDVPAHAKFITMGLLLFRFHNSLQEARNGGHPCGGWTKQAALAKVVGCFTGVRMNRADAEFIGNSHDARLSQFARQLRKARNSDRREVYVARKKGKEAQLGRATTLEERVFMCKYGGVPRVAVAENGGSLPLYPQPVPMRTVAPVEEINRQLQQEIQQLQHESQRERDCRLTMGALCAAVEKERKARKEMEQRMANEKAEHEARVAARDAKLAGLGDRLRELKSRLRCCGSALH